MKRISINEYEAHHLYELSLEHFQPNCVLCDMVKAKLEKFLGKEAPKIRRMIKTSGYCNRLK